ncbi:MAG TPA: hypothetical protein VGC07_08125 [Granulicella sp.]
MELGSIVGQELTAVEFVLDHLQLRFDGPLLTLYAWPEVFREEGSYAFGEPEYRNVLCGLIAVEVTAATLEEGEGLEIGFANGGTIRLSLREEDVDGPQAGGFSESGSVHDVDFEF